MAHRPLRDLIYLPLGLRLGPRCEDLERVGVYVEAPGSPHGVVYRQPSEDIAARREATRRPKL